MSPLPSIGYNPNSAAAIGTQRPLQTPDTQAPSVHPDKLWPARLSNTTQIALAQAVAQAVRETNIRHELVAILVQNGIKDGTLHLQSTQGTEARYSQAVEAPDVSSPEAIARRAKTASHLTVYARLNEHAEYDLLRADLEVPLSDAKASIDLSASLPAPMPERASSIAGVQARTNLALSQHGPAGATIPVSGAIRNPPAHEAHKAPYPAAPRPPGLRATPRRRREGADDELIRAHLYNPDRSLRTKWEVLSALSAYGLGADTSHVSKLLKAAKGGPTYGKATDEKISLYLRKDGGVLRTENEVRQALHDDGLGAGSDRILALLKPLRVP